MAETLTSNKLKEVASYDPETGLFFRLVKVSNVSAGNVLPKPSRNGYFRMRIDGRLYYMHRLAWLYVNGAWPKNLIDHVDGIKTNNKIDNLREAAFFENFQNITIKSKAASGLRGAYLDKASGRWQSKILFRGKRISNGYFDTAELAHAAYVEAKRRHHTFNPEFTR